MTTMTPTSFLAHATGLADSTVGRANDVDLRRGVSAAYFAVFHEVTDRAARHLIGSANEGDRNVIRRSWSHGEVTLAASLLLERAKVLSNNIAARPTTEVADLGPLVNIAISDSDLLLALRLFTSLQNLRHTADYDHNATVTKSQLLSACSDANAALAALDRATPPALEAFFTLLTVRRKHFREREN